MEFLSYYIFLKSLFCVFLTGAAFALRGSGVTIGGEFVAAVYDRRGGNFRRSQTRRYRDGRWNVDLFPLGLGCSILF